MVLLKGRKPKLQKRDSYCIGHREGGADLRGKKICAILILMAITILPLASVSPVSAAYVDFDVRVNTQILVAGKENVLTFTISNLGDTAATNTVVTFQSQGSMFSTGSMILLGTDGIFYLGQMSAKASKLITVSVYVSPSAAGSIVTIGLNVNYDGSSPFQTAQVTHSIGFSVAASDNTGPSLYPSFSNPSFTGGQNNTVYLIVTNMGQRDANNVLILLEMPGASTQQSGESIIPGLTTSVGGLSSGSSQFMIVGGEGKWTVDSIKKGQSVSLPVTIYASSGSMGSLYLFPVTISYTDNLTYVEDSRYAAARVLTTTLPTSVFQFEISTQNLKAGEVNNFTISVRNTYNTTAEGVTVQIGMPGASISSSSSYMSSQGSSFSIPSGSSSSFILIGEDGSWFIGNMAPGEERSIPVSVYISPSSSGSMAAFSVGASYTDIFGKAHQETKSIGVIVRGAIDFEILETSTFPIYITPGKSFSLSVNLINLGTSTATSMIVTPRANGQLVPASDAKIFLGDVAVNVPSSFTISYIAGDVSNGTYSVEAFYTYKDTLGQKLNGTLEIPITIRVANTTSTTTPTQTSGYLNLIIAFWPYIVVVAGLIIAIFIFRHYRNSRSSA